MAKKFAIIEDEEGEKRIVSSTWLSKNGQKMKWPPYKDIDRIKKAAIGHDKPDEDWKEYSIRFIKYKDDYINAVEDIKANLDEDTSDPDKRRKSRSVRKRKIIKDAELYVKKKSKKMIGINKELLDEVENSDEDSGEDSGDASDSDDEHDTDIQSEGGRSVEQNDGSAKKDKEPNSCTEERLDITDKIIDVDSIAEVLANVPTSTPQSANEQFTIDDKLDVIYETLKKVSQNVNVISQPLTLMESRMGKLESGHINVNGEETQLAILSEIAKYFPIDTENKLSVIEEKLATKNFFLDVVKFMQSKGGANHHDLVYNILSAIIKDEMAKEFSFFGQKKKKKFTDLKVNSAVFFAVRTVFKDITDADIKNSVKSWLDAASTRFDRSQRAAGRKKQCYVPVLPLE